MFTSGSGVDVEVGAGLGVDIGGIGVEVVHPLKRILISNVKIGIFFILSPLFGCPIIGAGNRGDIPPAKGISWSYRTTGVNCLTRLPANLKVQPVNEGLDLRRSGRMPIRIVENNCQ